MARLYDDFVDGTTGADITSTDTSVSSAGLADLRVVSGADYVYVTLDADGSAGAPEVVRVTSHTAGASSATIARGQLGTTARAHLAGTDWSASVYQSDFERLDTLDSQVAALTAADTSLDGRLDAIEADDWVTQNRIAAAAVGDTELQDNAVTTAKIQNSAVTAAKVATGVLTDDKMASGLHLVPAGAMMEWPAAAAPTGWLICDGAAVSRTTYATLFGVIGTTWGAGDGSTTFNLPNRKGMVGVGLDSGQTEFDTLGETGGAKTHTLVAGEMPAHTHSIDHDHASASTSTDGSHTHGPAAPNDLIVVQDDDTPGNSVTVGAGPYTATNVISLESAGSHAHTVDLPNHTGSSGSAGSGSAHNNLQPYVVLNYIIRT